jgi:hypothetical protein
MASSFDGEFVGGLYADKERTEAAPDWVICKLSIKTADLAEYLKSKGDKEWLNCDVLEKKDKSAYYVKLDKWEPTENKDEPSF